MALIDEEDNNDPPIPPELEEDASATLYKYRDFASIEDLEKDLTETPGQRLNTQQQQNGGVESSIRVQKFPVKLYAILSQKEFSDIITWVRFLASVFGVTRARS
jgi:hypothetical protein